MNEVAPKKTLDTRLSWVSHPARRQPLKALLAVLVAIAMAIVAAGWGGTWLGVLSFVVVVGSVQSFLFPTRYHITEDKLTVESLFGTQQRPWSTLRRADTGRHGVHLSPFSTRSWLDATRGIYVRFDENREDVLAAITERIKGSPAEEDDSPATAGPRPVELEQQTEEQSR
ncbi:MAG: hypothetical protein ACOCVR_03295 [Myxococcota bacterium]